MDDVHVLRSSSTPRAQEDSVSTPSAIATWFQRDVTRRRRDDAQRLAYEIH